MARASPAPAPPKPTPEEEERKRRERSAKLLKCFRACDLDDNGLIDAFELEVAVRSFNPQCSNVDQEVKTVLGKLDKNQDSKIDPNEWTNGLMDLFQFMSNDAFERHCDELLSLIKQNAERVRQQLLSSHDGKKKPAAGAGAGSSSSSSSAAAAAAAGSTSPSPAPGPQVAGSGGSSSSSSSSNISNPSPFPHPPKAANVTSTGAKK